MLNFVQYEACLHLSVQNVWGAHFFLDTLCIYIYIFRITAIISRNMIKMLQRTNVLSRCTADIKVVNVICNYVTTFQGIFVRQRILTYAIFSYACYTYFIVQNTMRIIRTVDWVEL